MSFKSTFQKEGNQVYKSRNESGFSFENYLDLKQFEIERFKDKDNSDYRVDIIPYTITTDNHPEKKKGEKTFHLDLWVHKQIGVNKGNYICMKKNYNQPCKICEHFQKLQNEGQDWEDIKHLYPQRRSIYWFLYNGKLFVADMSFKTFEELWLQAVEKYNQKGKDIFPVYFNEGGCTSLEFSTTDKKGIGRYVQFDFPGIENYNPDIEKRVRSLETLIIIPDQSRLESIVFGDEEIKEEVVEERYEAKETVPLKESIQELNDHVYNDPYYEEVVAKDEPIKKKKKLDECPYGTQYGVDWDSYEHCDKCINDHQETYEGCKKVYKEKV